MAVSSTVRIGGELIDITRPCDVYYALLKTQLKLATGSLRETVRINDEEVTFQRASDRRLAAMLAQFKELCPSAKAGRQRSRFAKSIRWT